MNFAAPPAFLDLGRNDFGGPHFGGGGGFSPTRDPQPSLNENAPLKKATGDSASAALPHLICNECHIGFRIQSHTLAS